VLGRPEFSLGVSFTLLQDVRYWHQADLFSDLRQRQLLTLSGRDKSRYHLNESVG